MGVQAEYRAAAVALLTDCAANAGVGMQVYRARPRTLKPPTGFIDGLFDTLAPMPGSSNLFSHTPTVEVVCVWGLYDSGEAADQRDAFVDAFHDWIRERPHQASARSLIAPVTVRDEPNFVPDWLPEEQQLSYYATRIVLEGLKSD